MLYESRRILLGFRIKLNFDTSLNRENSYIFVNLSKTPTIGDLLVTIRDRFEISQEVYITLNDCRLLSSENNAVLIDVSEVRIVPCENERNVSFSKTTQEFVADVRDNSIVFNCPVQTDTELENSNVVSEKKKRLYNDEAKNIPQNNHATRTNEIPDRKCRRFYSGVAETLRYLHQNYIPASNEVTSAENENGKENNLEGIKERENFPEEQELYFQNNASFEETKDEIEKRKRKRKRKHSKKAKLECDQKEISQSRSYVYSSVEISVVDTSSSKSARHHIFFDSKGDPSAELEDHSNEYKLPSNASSSTPLADNRPQHLAANSDKRLEVNVIGKNEMTDVTDGNCFKKAKCDKLETHHLISDVVSESEENVFEQISRSRREAIDTESSNVKYAATCGRSVQSHSASSSNEGFFSTVNSTTTSGSATRAANEILSKSPNPLATLLMCKQLQTPVEYNVQFTRFNGVSRNQNNSPRIPGENNQTETDKQKPHDDDECQVLCQYKIVGDKILLRDSNSMWNILSEEEVSLKLQPVDEPRENQSITFQMLYLGANMCPTLSNLICGKVISFHKDDGRLTLTILPAFLDNLAKCSEEGTSLPDELVHVTENVYHVSWLAVKNPRLLM